MAHIRQSRPDSGLVFQVKVNETCLSGSLFVRKRREESRATTVERKRIKDWAGGERARERERGERERQQVESPWTSTRAVETVHSIQENGSVYSSSLFIKTTLRVKRRLTY